MGRKPGSKNKPKIDAIVPVVKSQQKKRGRKAGGKNAKGFSGIALVGVAKAGETVETLEKSFLAEMKNASGDRADEIGKGTSLLNNIQGYLADLMMLIEELPPQASLNFEIGAWVILNEKFSKAFDGATEAMEIQEVIDMGKGPGNGVFIQTAGGLFPKSALMLVAPPKKQAELPLQKIEVPVTFPKKTNVVPRPSVPNGHNLIPAEDDAEAELNA